ncbi:MAG: CBS domain-containing protein, partial [Geminicoccaceae bacterium]|nr:CBS domain-containing protein [Geminicoccaceae bacterium]
LLPNAPEACPIGCAPTTSSTLMLVLGDALALALMRRKAFTPSDFRLRHPGGKLGRRLTQVEDLLHGSDSTPLVHLDASMAEVILEMTRTGYGSTGVIDDHGLLVGLISDADVRRHMGPGLLDLRAGELLSEVPVEIRPDMLASEALGLMSTLGVRAAIVTEGARPIGVLHVDDCRRAEVA